MQRRFVVAGVIAVVTTAILLPGSGFGSAAVGRGTQTISAGLAAAIDARLGAAAISSSLAARDWYAPVLGASVAVSADGTTALVGAPGVGHHGEGAAFVFHVSGADSWSSTGTPTATLESGHASTRMFGAAVALSADGTTAFVGASSNFDTGAIYVFRVSGEDAWASSSAPAATLTEGNSGSSLFGQTPLAVSSDGTTLVASDPFYADSAGTAFVFHVANEGAWATSATPTATLSSACCEGVGVAISGDGTTVLLSDAYNDITGGGAYIYHVPAEDSWTSTTTPTAILTDANSPTGVGSSDALGFSVALSGDGTVALLDTAGGQLGAGLCGRLPRLRGRCLGLDVVADRDPDGDRRRDA